MARQLEKNRIVWVLAICVFGVVGWLVHEQFLSGPDHTEDSAGTPPEISAPALPPISVRTGNSVQAPIGGFTISADRVSSSSASLTITSETKDKYHFKNASAGQRLMIPTHAGTYYLDIVHVHGSTIKLTIGKQR